MNEVFRSDSLARLGTLVLELARQRVRPGQRHLTVDVGGNAIRLVDGAFRSG